MTTQMMDRPRRIIPDLSGFYDAISPYGYAIMRFSTGAVLFPHGLQKLLHPAEAAAAAGIAQHGLPVAMFLAYATVFTEGVASVALALGLFTRLAAIMIFIEMVVISTFFLSANGYFWTQKGYEFALLWALLCIGIFCRGGGCYSLDRLIGWEF